MRLLIDTHVLIWAVSRPERLGTRIRTALVAPGTTAFVSAVSAWEIAIKRALGRLGFPLEDFDRVLDEAGPPSIAC